MASTVRIIKHGPKEYTIEVDETSLTTSSEATIDLPAELQLFRLYSYISRLRSGAAATIQPTLGRVTNPTNAEDIELQATAGAGPFTEYLSPPLRMMANGALKLYHRAKPNTGSDNSVLTRYRVRAGWEG